MGADSRGYDAATAARPVLDHECIGPAWLGSADWRHADILRARTPRLTPLAYLAHAHYMVPGAPPELRTLAGEILSVEQGRRDMAFRFSAIALGKADPPHVGCRGTDADLRALMVELLEATAPGADLRLVAWRWLRWAAFESTQSCSATLGGLGGAALALTRARQLLDGLVAGEDVSRARAAWASVLAATDRALLSGPEHSHRMALWALRHGLEVNAWMRPRSLGFAARCWIAQGGDAVEGLRQLAALLATAPAWPAEVSA